MSLELVGTGRSFLERAAEWEDCEDDPSSWPLEWRPLDAEDLPESLLLEVQGMVELLEEDAASGIDAAGLVLLRAEGATSSGYSMGVPVVGCDHHRVVLAIRRHGRPARLLGEASRWEFEDRASVTLRLLG